MPTENLNPRKKPTKTTQKAAAESSSEAKQRDFIQTWFTELESARKREKDWRERAKYLVQVYEGELPEKVPFNILYSNTETLMPAVYSSCPQPVVKPRYNPKSPIPKLVAQTSEAYLDFFVSANEPEYPSFDSTISSAVLSALVPGRGLTRFCYDAEVEKDEKQAPKSIAYECLYPEDVPYNRFLHGFAKTWQQVPWIAFEHFLTKDEAVSMFGPEAAVVPFLERESPNSSDKATQVADSEGVQLSLWYEIWDKAERKMFFICDGYNKKIWKEQDDPFKLEGFYPVPEPLGFVRKISSLVPKELYALYQNQANELNTLTRRIQAVSAAIKATGFYNSQIEGLKGVIELEDGKMMPIENLQALGDNADLSKAVWMWPAKEFVVVLQQLQQERELVKQVIYEIMGIADILRGSTVASETATAQTLKSKWGGIRIKRFQKEVARYTRDCLRLVAELAFSKLSDKTLAAATVTPLPSKEEKAAAVQKMQIMMAQAQAAPPQMGPNGQPLSPQPPQVPPEIQPILAAPTYEEVFAILRSDLLTDYAVDIETDSTIADEAQEDKEALTEFLSAMGQFFMAVGPLVENGTLPFGAAKQMLLSISRKFRLGRELDDELEAMQAPQNPGGQDKAAQEALQKDQMQLASDKAQFQQQVTQQKGQLQLQKLQNDMAAMLKQMQTKVQSEKEKAAIQQLLSKLELEMEKHAQAMDLQHQRNMAEVHTANTIAETNRRAAEAVSAAKASAAAKKPAKE